MKIHDLDGPETTRACKIAEPRFQGNYLQVTFTPSIIIIQELKGILPKLIST